MALIGFMESGLATRRVSSKPFLMRSDIIAEDAPRGAYWPNLKLVEQAPGAELQAHFHLVDQFQVIVSGDGKLGATPVAPTAVHYAAAHTAYGPIVAGVDGVHYLVARDYVDSKAKYMPESRAEQRDTPRRHLISDPAPPLSSVHLATLDKPIIRDLFKPQSDGLAAVLIRLPPRHDWIGADPKAGRGHFHIVLAGVARTNGDRLTPLSGVFTAPEEPPLRLSAGEGGAEILMLQFPRAA